LKMCVFFFSFSSSFSHRGSRVFARQAFLTKKKIMKMTECWYHE
jgi:hypothetical protein